jgi:hypothetical protein
VLIVSPQLVAPQLVVNSRMLYFGWIPEDPDALRATLPPGLTPIENAQVFMNQYVVDAPEQTTGFGAYSLTYAGLDLSRCAPDGVTPSRWWTHYFNSSPDMRDYVLARGVPATAGRTTIELSAGSVVATTYSGDTPIIRSTAKIGLPAVTANGQLSYITDIGGRLVDGIYPWVATLVDPWEVTSLEFLDPSSSVYALRPKSPLEVTWGFYSPNASFCYPGGEFAVV